MVKVKEDLTGRTFGRLTVLEQTDDRILGRGEHIAQWLCECSCSDKNKVIVSGYNLKKKNGTRSCGCLQRERAIEINKKYNKYDLSGEYGIGYTSNTDEEFYFDLEDYDKIKDYTWYVRVNNQGYKELLAKYNNKTIKMHWIIYGKYCDHKNLSTLDNRKENLRDATSSQNSMNQHKQSNNTSGFIGVSFDKETNKWVAYININKHKKKDWKIFKERRCNCC